MRKNILSLSIAALTDGLGRPENAVAVVPYYTLPSPRPMLVNPDEPRGHAVKVRFRGSISRDDVFDFALFLAPGDVWKPQPTPHPARR